MGIAMYNIIGLIDNNKKYNINALFKDCFYFYNNFPNNSSGFKIWGPGGPKRRQQIVLIVKIETLKAL